MHLIDNVLIGTVMLMAGGLFLASFAGKRRL